jgi:hypothetical protein
MYNLDNGGNSSNDSFIDIDNLEPGDFEDLSQTNVPKLTQVLAILGVCISLVGIVGNMFSIIVLNRKAMKKLSTYTYLLGLAVCDEISLTFTVIILFAYAVPSNTNIARAFSFNYNYKILLIYVYVRFDYILNGSVGTRPRPGRPKSR